MIRADPTPLRVRFGEFELDEANAMLQRGGRTIELAPTPFGLLCTLLRHPGSLLTKHMLLDEVWGHRFVSDSVLKTAISDLRSILADNAREPRYIETVARRGYRFIARPAELRESTPHRTDAPEIDQPRTTAFVGRGEELKRLKRSWDRASRGERAVVWVAGEPGIGKTTLIECFQSNHRDGACARGYCVEHYGSGEPYLPVLEALSQLCRIDDSLPSLLRSVAPMWLLQLPWLVSAEDRERLRQELVGVSPDRMLREMGELLNRYTEIQPLLLVTEDLHWADKATIQLVDYIARRRSDARLMWLASFRLTEVVASDHPLNALRHELRVHGLCEEIVLDPFTEAEVAAYLSGRSCSLGSNEKFVRALHARTDGVPLFVASVTEDVLARVGQSGMEAIDGDELSRMAVPENVTAIMDRYVLKLAPERRSLLSAAAVCGVYFRIETLARVLDRKAVEIADACDQLIREQLWLAVPAGREAGDSQEASHAFRHAVFRQVLYEHLPPSVLAELHRNVGMALEQERASGRAVTASELAMHFDLGRAPMAALRYYAEGAETALLNLNPVQCMSLTGRALTLLDRAPACVERTSLEVTLAALRGVSAFRVFGTGDEAKNSLQRACSLIADNPAHPMRGLVLHALGILHCVRGEFDDALATADRAEALASETGDPFLPLAACNVRGQVYSYQGRPGAARATLERALPAIEAADGAEGAFEHRFIAEPCATLLAMLSTPLANLGLVAQARERLQQAYERARRLGQPMALMVAIWHDLMLHVRLGDVDRVASLAEEMRALIDKFVLPQGRSAWRRFRGWSDARQGKALEGFRQIRAAHDERIAAGMVAGASETLGYAAEALLLHGDWHAAQEQLDQALEIVETNGERIYLPQLLLIESAIAHACGQLDVAIASIRRAIEEARGQGATWLELLALTELGEREAANAEDRRALAALVGQLSEATETIAIARARALLAPA